MIDGNTYAISKRLNDEEDWDALQEVTAELEQAEARIEELEGKLAKAVEVAEKSIGWLRLYGADVHKESTTLAELKGKDDE